MIQRGHLRLVEPLPADDVEPNVTTEVPGDIASKVDLAAEYLRGVQDVIDRLGGDDVSKHALSVAFQLGRKFQTRVYEREVGWSG